ncbi:MAG: hypothetical protein WKF96_23910 [Solirubrobacteraceae bacterium]
MFFLVVGVISQLPFAEPSREGKRWDWTMDDGTHQLLRMLDQIREAAGRRSVEAVRAEAGNTARRTAEERADREAARVKAEVVAAFVRAMARAGDPGIRPCVVGRWIPLLNVTVDRRLPGAAGWVIRPSGRYESYGGISDASGVAVIADRRVVHTHSSFVGKRIHLATNRADGQLRPVRPIEISVSDLASALERYHVDSTYLEG